MAEGISMAIQGAGLLCTLLVGQQNAELSAQRMREVVHAYAAGWRDNFAPRVRAAAWFAHLAMRPATSTPLVALLRLAPNLLTLGARLSAKTRALKHHSNAATAPD